jgi:hypothetical protein
VIGARRGHFVSRAGGEFGRAVVDESFGVLGECDFLFIENVGNLVQ